MLFQDYWILILVKFFNVLLVKACLMWLFVMVLPSDSERICFQLSFMKQMYNVFQLFMEASTMIAFSLKSAYYSQNYASNFSQ